MDEKAMKDHPEGCKCMACEGGKCSVCGDYHCSGCGMCHQWEGKHFVLRWILGIIILAVVFWMGVKFGELKEIISGGGYLGYYPGHYTMMGGGYDYGYGGMINPYFYGYGPGMMGQWNARNSTSTSR